MAVLLSLGLALAIVFFMPNFIHEEEIINVNIVNDKSQVKQEVIGYNKQEKELNKIYSNGKFVGIVSDLDYLNSLIKQKYQDYEKDFPNTSLGLCDDVYIVKEKGYVDVENVDDKIFDYLVNNDLLGIETNAIEFSTNEGIYDIIYVKNIH